MMKKEQKLRSLSGRISELRRRLNSKGIELTRLIALPHSYVIEGKREGKTCEMRSSIWFDCEPDARNEADAILECWNPKGLFPAGLLSMKPGSPSKVEIVLREDGKACVSFAEFVHVPQRLPFESEISKPVADMQRKAYESAKAKAVRVMKDGTLEVPSAKEIVLCI